MKQIRISKKKVILHRKDIPISGQSPQAAEPPSQADQLLIKCPACELELEAPASDAGQTFDCPNCGQPVFVKAPLTLKASPQRPVQEDTTNACHYCRHPLPAAAVFCVYCGRDLKTGKKLKVRSGDRRTYRDVVGKIIGSLLAVLLVVAILMLSLIAWSAWRKRTTTLSGAVQETVRSWMRRP